MNSESHHDCAQGCSWDIKTSDVWNESVWCGIWMNCMYVETHHINMECSQQWTLCTYESTNWKCINKGILAYCCYCNMQSSQQRITETQLYSSLPSNYKKEISRYLSLIKSRFPMLELSEMLIYIPRWNPVTPKKDLKLFYYLEKFVKHKIIYKHIHRVNKKCQIKCEVIHAQNLRMNSRLVLSQSERQHT
jgi:hypothetical protein